MPTFTTNFNLAKPLVNSPVDEDLWGDELNDDMDIIDSIVYTAQRFVTRAVTTTDVSTTADNHKLLLCDATSGAFTVTLPLAATADDGFTIAIKKTDATRNIVTIDGSGAETVDGLSTYLLAGTNDSVILVCDGTNWKIVSKISTPVAYSTPSGTGTTIDFTGIPTTARKITLTLVDVSISGPAENPWLFRIGGGSYESTGYHSSSSALQNVSPFVISTKNTTGFPLYVNQPTVLASGVVNFTLSDAATNTWCYDANVADSDVAVNFVGAGSKSIGMPLDRIRLTTVNGTDTFDGGTVNISYE
jgi:hypothetical protein